MRFQNMKFEIGLIFQLENEWYLKNVRAARVFC